MPRVSQIHVDHGVKNNESGVGLMVYTPSVQVPMFAGTFFPLRGQSSGVSNNIIGYSSTVIHKSKSIYSLSNNQRSG